MQGSGKSTQAKILSEKLNVPYVEMGQVLRDKSQEESEIGHKIKQALDAGVLVDNQITIEALNEKLGGDEFKNGFVIDGYPRNQLQLENLPQGIDKVFYIKVSKDENLKRLTSRGRYDDTPQLIEKRIEIYLKETEPLLDYFKKLNILDEVDGERSIEEIAADLQNRIKNGTN